MFQLAAKYFLILIATVTAQIAVQCHGGQTENQKQQCVFYDPVPLFFAEAVAKGDMLTVENYLTRGEGHWQNIAQGQQLDYLGDSSLKTALYCATVCDHVNVARQLMQSHDYSITTIENFVFAASTLGNADVVKLFMSDQRFKPAAYDNRLLRTASLRDHAAVVEVLLTNAHVDPNKACFPRSDNLQMLMAVVANRRFDLTLKLQASYCAWKKPDKKVMLQALVMVYARDAQSQPYFVQQAFTRWVLSQQNQILLDIELTRSDYLQEWKAALPHWWTRFSQLVVPGQRRTREMIYAPGSRLVQKASRRFADAQEETGTPAVKRLRIK